MMQRKRAIIESWKKNTKKPKIHVKRKESFQNSKFKLQYLMHNLWTISQEASNVTHTDDFAWLERNQIIIQYAENISLRYFMQNFICKQVKEY